MKLTWARGVTITNTFNDYGEVIRKDYSDGTPSVAFDNLNRAGQPSYITDALGLWYLTYDFASRPQAVTWLDGPLYGLTANNQYDPVFGRTQVTLDSWGTPLLVHDYGYDADTGRLSFVSNGVFTAAYAYTPGSDLLQTTTCKSNTTTVLTTSRTWEYAMRLGAIVNAANGVAVSSHSYTYDSVHRRTAATLEDGSRWDYGYNDRNELTSAQRSWLDWTPVAGQQFGYDYDCIGNRKTAEAGGDSSGTGLRPVGYAVNSLNQYTTITNLGYADILGVALATNGVTVNGGLAERKVEYFHREISVVNSNGPVWQNVQVVSAGVTNTGGLIIPDNEQALTYDLDGNLTFDGTWSYEWDAENRLKQVESLATGPTASKRKVIWEFDARGRRIRQTSYDGSTGSYAITEDLKFLSDGWRHIAELNATNNALVRSYVWGLDLSGSLYGAGGVGGLLVVNSTANGTHFCAYDGNGNVAALVKATDGTESARYEYGPFGEAIRVTGAMAKENPFRFSTKRTDNSTDFVLYEYRLYSPSMGRWLSRDPFEQGNPYVIVGNNTLSGYDVMGLWGRDVHYGRTMQWASELGIQYPLTHNIGVFDNAIDDFYPTWNPISDANWSWHFNRARSNNDTRLAHRTEELEKAKRECTAPSDFSYSAASYLGRALHPLQDYIAHGDFNRWIESPSLSVNSLYYWHNWGKGGWTTGWWTSHEPDDPTLDTDSALYGSPTMGIMEYGTTLSNGDRIYYAQFHIGSQRIGQTEKLTKELLREFQDYVRSYSVPCGRCQQDFLGGN